MDMTKMRRELSLKISACSKALVDGATMSQLLSGPANVPTISWESVAENHGIDSLTLNGEGRRLVLVANCAGVELTLNVEAMYDKTN